MIKGWVLLAGMMLALPFPSLPAESEPDEAGLASKLKQTQEIVLKAQQESVEAKESLEVALTRMDSAIEMVGKAADAVKNAQVYADRLLEKTAGARETAQQTTETVKKSKEELKKSGKQLDKAKSSMDKLKMKFKK